MAGPSEISGVQPGVVPGKQGGDFSSIASGVGMMMNAIVNAKIKGKEMAFQEFTRMTEAAKAGIPIDPKVIEKTAKRAGMPLMKPEDMEAFLRGQANPHPDIQVPSGAVPGGATLPGQAMQPKGANPQSAVMDAGVRQKQAQESVMTSWVQNALKMSQMQGANQQQQLQLSNQLLDLKSKAAAGDANAVGKLMAAGGMPFSMDFLHWTSMSDAQRAKAVDVATGHESEADFAKRRDNIRNSLMDQGLFSNPEAANKAADAIAQGHDIPADIKSSMKPFTMQDMVAQSDMLMKGVQLGIPNDQLQGFATRASQVGIMNALPTGLHPLATQELEMRQKELGINIARYQAELAHYNAIAAKMDAVAQRESAKASLDQFRSLVEIKKAGGTVPEDLMNNAINDLATQMGMEVREVNNMFHFITGGTHFEMKPRAASDLVKSAAGSQTATSPQSSTFGSMVKGLSDYMFGGPKTKNPGEDNQL